MEGVSLRYVSDSVASLGQPDLVILPGTKNTMEDLNWLRQSGLEAAILPPRQPGAARYWASAAATRCWVAACLDPEGVEAGGQMRGMGLLEAETVFQGEKTRTRVRGRVLQAQGIFRAPGGNGLCRL